MAKTVNGRERAWQIQELVGSGDAGEVLRVFSQPGNLQGVMKRPVQNVSGGTIVRQAAQIETEGKILTALEGINFSRNSLTIRTPLLLDRSSEGSANTVNLFIVSEEIQGRSISSLLTERLNTGQSIPQNLVLKVLSSLFLLLENAHSKGVVWNDVKMDHIFWNAETKTMSFIDWGNGIFFQPQTDVQNSPVWQDYTQMIEEGLSLLNQTSPHLIYDLGWPLHPSEFTPANIPQLKMRVEYLESYLTMRAIEYELLFERFTKSMPDLDALKQTLDLHQELQQFGINTNFSSLLSAGQKLLLNYFANKDNQKVDQLLDLIETSLKDNLPFEWQMASYLLKLKNVISTEKLSELLDNVFASNWVESVWLTRLLIEQHYTPQELGSAVFAMRSVYLNGSSTPTIYSELKSFISLLEEQLLFLQNHSSKESEVIIYLKTLTAKMQEIATHWSVLMPGEVLGNQLFNLRQVISDATAIKLKHPVTLSDQLQKALSSTRNVYQSWNAADMEGCLKAVKRLYIIEPTLDYLLPLAESITRMKSNLIDFETGPEMDQSVNSFAVNLLSSTDDLPDHLGTPDWLRNYNLALQEMKQANNLENLQDLARHHNWPTQWVFQPGLKLDVPYDQLAQSSLNEQQLTTLRSFHIQLRTSQSIAEPLINLRRFLPSCYGSYKDLEEEFQFIFSDIPRESYLPDLKNFPAQDAADVDQALRVLGQAENWKNAIEIGDWFYMKTLADSFEPGWTLLTDMRSAANLWVTEVLPALAEIKQRKWKSTRYTQLLKPKLLSLAEAQAHLYTFICEWQKIEHQGLYLELLNELVYQSDAAQNSFFNSWQQLLRSDSKAAVWLTQNQQGIFSEINQMLLSLYRSLRALLRNFEVINQPEMARTRLAQNAAGDLMFLLIKVDETVSSTQKASPVFKRWQRQYLDLLAVADSSKIRQGIQEIESVHPLLPWFDELVQRDTGYFEQTSDHQW